MTLGDDIVLVAAVVSVLTIGGVGVIICGNIKMTAAATRPSAIIPAAMAFQWAPINCVVL